MSYDVSCYIFCKHTAYQYSLKYGYSEPTCFHILPARVYGINPWSIHQHILPPTFWLFIVTLASLHNFSNTFTQDHNTSLQLVKPLLPVGVRVRDHSLHRSCLTAYQNIPNHNNNQYLTFWYYCNHIHYKDKPKLEDYSYEHISMQSASLKVF